MHIILCSLTFVICFAVQVDSQLAKKRIGEWSPDRYHMYPNPWENEENNCRTNETSGLGLCDYNEMLTFEQKKELSVQPEINVTDADKRDLCKQVNGTIRIMVTVAVMKKIGPDITDYRAATIEFAGKFRTAWDLHNCSVILVASQLDNTSYLDAGVDVVNLLTANVTDKIDRDVYEKYIKKGLLYDGINATLFEYRTELEKEALKTTVLPTTTTTTAATAPSTEQTDELGESSGSTATIVGVIIGFLVVLIVIIIGIIIFIRYKKKTREGNINEAKHLKEPPPPENV